MTRALQTAYDALVVEFLLPLLEGGTASVGRPIAPGAASYFAMARSGSDDADRRLAEAFHRRANEVARADVVPWPSLALVALTAAAHDLFFLVDPSLNRVMTRRARPVVASWVRGWLELVPPPRTRGDVLGRHVFAQRFLRAQRTDLTVHTWVAKYRYYGRPAPWNVVALPSLRAVREEREARSIAQLVAIEDDVELATLGVGELVDALVVRSPLTVLLSRLPERGFAFSASTIAVLTDRSLRAAVASSLVEREWESGAAIADAVFDARLRSAPPSLAVALQLVVEMHLVSAVDGRERPVPMPSARDVGLARYFALIVASLDDARAVLELAAFDPSHRVTLQRRVEVYRARVPAHVLGEARELVALAMASEPPFLPH